VCEHEARLAVICGLKTDLLVSAYRQVSHQWVSHVEKVFGFAKVSTVKKGPPNTMVVRQFSDLRLSVQGHLRPIKQTWENLGVLHKDMAKVVEDFLIIFGLSADLVGALSEPTSRLQAAKKHIQTLAHHGEMWFELFGTCAENFSDTHQFIRVVDKYRKTLSDDYSAPFSAVFSEYLCGYVNSILQMAEQFALAYVGAEKRTFDAQALVKSADWATSHTAAGDGATTSGVAGSQFDKALLPFLKKAVKASSHDMSADSSPDDDLTRELTDSVGLSSQYKDESAPLIQHACVKIANFKNRSDSASLYRAALGLSGVRGASQQVRPGHNTTHRNRVTQHSTAQHDAKKAVDDVSRKRLRQ
jgi:hypothetical protein